MAAGSNKMFCHEKEHLNLSIVAAAGPLTLTNIDRLVLGAPEQELLLRRETLQSIGVDRDGSFEQRNLEKADAEADDVPSEHVEQLGAAGADEVKTTLEAMVEEAVEAGFDLSHADARRGIVMDYSDVFRL